MADSNTRMPKGNAVYINRLNKIKILGLIRDYSTISRAELVTKSGLSAPTVTRIVNSLIRDEKLVQSIGMGSSNGGRPPVMLKFNGQKNYVIGIDLGATAIRGVLSDLNGKFLEEIEIKTQPKKEIKSNKRKLENKTVIETKKTKTISNKKQKSNEIALLITISIF